MGFVKDEESDTFSLQFSTTEEALEGRAEKMDKTHDILSKEFKNAKIIYSPVVGCNLGDVNSPNRALVNRDDHELFNALKERHPHQHLLNTTILQLYYKTVEFNLQNNVPTPLILSTIHKSRSQNRGHGHFYN